MEKNIECSSIMESNNAEFETVYIITEEELVNSFNLENQDTEIIVDGSFFIPEENSFDLDGQNAHLQNKENILDDNKLMPVILEKDISNGTVNNYENISDQLLEDNFNSIEVATRGNENSFIENSQPTVIDHDPNSVDQNILMNHVLSSVMDSEQNSILVPNRDSSMVHDQKETSDCRQIIQRKSSISSFSKHAPNDKLQSSDWDTLMCPYCMKEFSKAYLMKRHMVTVHKFPASEAPFPCFYCKALHQQEDLLLKHYEVEHKYRHQTALAMVKRYSTKKCDKGYRMRKHVVTSHKFPASEAPFSCSYCNASFQQENFLLTHYEVQHNMLMTALGGSKDVRDSVPSEIPPDIEKDVRDSVPSEIPPDIEKDERDTFPSEISPDIDRIKPAPPSKSNIGRIKCIECNINFSHFRSFREHLLKYHNLDVTEKEMRFPNMTAFKKWKLDIERRDLTFFTAQTGAKKLLNCIYRRYCCHRSGYRDKPGANKNRMKNVIGSSKTGFFCTASMTVTEYSHEVHVKYCLQHYGHGGGITFGHLSNEQQAAIQENVLNGIPLEEQLNDIKDAQTSAEHFQALIMKKRDISFIDRAYASEVYNAGMNAVEYVEQWVRTCSEMEDSPILLYRHEGAGSKSEDLMLIIMTEFQKHILMTSTKEVVCLAYPNRIKKGHNLLTALVVIDDQEVAFPVAFCISNKVNKSSMLEFLSSVKESTGPLSCSYFMSNDDKFFYEAWQEVMQDESKWVWSIWSFDDRIRKLLWQPKTAVKDINTREATYQLFRTIIECSSQPVFTTMFKNYKTSLLDNAMTSDFGKHFVSQYDSNPEMWACCYRKDIKLSTNIFIEYLYKTMQYCGKITRTRQLDKFLMVVMKWLRCKMLDRLSNILDEDKINLAKNTISICHNMGLEIECENVVSLSDKIWLIRSQNEVDVYVTQEYESCPELCDLRCPDCDVCVHMYSCSCEQSLIHANMCQHIHAVVWKFLTPHFSPPASPVPDPCDDVDDISADVQIIADKEPCILKSVLKRMQGVYKQVRINKCKLNKSSLLEVLRLLNRCYQICSCDEKPPHLLSESTQTEYNLVSKSKTEEDLVSKFKSEVVPLRSSNRVLKGLDNNLLISYPSSIPVMAFDSDLHTVKNSSNRPLNSSSVSMPPPKITLKSLNNSERRKNIDAFLCKAASNAALNYRTLGSFSERHETGSLQAATNLLSTTSKRCKKFTLVPTAPLKIPLGCSLSNVPNSVVHNPEGVNFIPVASPNNGSDKVGTISLIPSHPVPSSNSYSVLNSRPVAKKRHIERTIVLDVSSMKDSSKVSDSQMTNSSLIVKTTVSSSDNLPAVSVNTVSNSVSHSRPAVKKQYIERTDVPDVLLMKNSSNVSDSPVTNSPLIVKTTVSSSDILPAASANTVSNSVSPASSVIVPTAALVSAMKNNSELKANSTNQVLSITVPGASGNKVTNYVLQTPVGKPTAVLDLTLKNHSDVKGNSTDQVLFITVPDASVNHVTNSVEKPTAVSDSTSKNHSEVKANSTDQVLFITVPDATVNNATNSVLQTPVVKPTAVSDSTSKNHSEVKANSTSQLSYVGLPDVSVSTPSNSIQQVSSVVKPTGMPVFILNNNFDARTHSASKIFYLAVPDASANILSNSVPQSSLAMKPTATSILTSNNNSNVTSSSANHLLYVMLPHIPLNSALNLASQAPSDFKSTTVPVSKSNNHSDVTAHSFSQVLPIPLPVASTNAGSNFISHEPVISSNNSSDKSDKIRRIPILSSNSVPNLNSNYSPVAKRCPIERTNFSGGPLSKDSSNISSDPVTNLHFIVKTTVSTSDNLPAISVNTVSNSVSHTKPVAKRLHIERTSVPDVTLTKDSSNFSGNTVMNSSLIVKTTVSSSDHLPAVNTVSNSVSQSKPLAKKRHIERTSVPDVPLTKSSLNVSSDPVTSSPLIAKTTVSSSTNLPAVSVIDSVSQVSSVIKPSAMSASTSNNSTVATHFTDKVSCFEKIPDEISNSSDFQLVTSSSVKSCQGKSDAPLATTPCYILKPSSHIITSSDVVKSSQLPVSTPNKQPGSLQFLWEPVGKKRYVVKARVPFTP